MITSSDREYKVTKKIKQGKKRLQPPFDELARWIGSKWNVTVLNVTYDRANSLHAPRLQVILEHKMHARKFHRGFNFDKDKQNAIASRFLEIIGRDGAHDFDVDGLFVVFSAFAPLAREEADSQISDEEIQSLKARMGNPDIWEILRLFGHVTIFFFTDAQVKRYEAGGKKQEYARIYYEILKPHDEFGYLKERDFKIDFDSKQNFDENYESNWFYYFK
jgi:hypothetical protein